MKPNTLLSEIFSKDIGDNKIDVIVAGAGVAGVFSALELLKTYPSVRVKIIEQKEKILSGTSANTPGRMGLGYHYKDLTTAINYMRNTLVFMKKYHDCFIEDESKPNLENGRYFILKDSIVDPQDLISTYDKLSLEFERLWMSDPEVQKLFPGTCHLHRAIPPSEYSEYVDPKIVHLAIETREKLLDWNRFEKKVLAELSEFIENERVEILNSTEVLGVAYNKDASFEVKLEKKTSEGKIKIYQTADFFINATWQNIELLNKKFNISTIKWTSRMKLLAEVSIPDSMTDAHSMFFCLGPFAMFSNMGLKKDPQDSSKDSSIARITYANVTNHSHYPSDEMPDFYRRLLEKDLSEDEMKYLNEKGKEIIDGVAKYIPKMSDSSLIRVLPGIVKSVGGVDINDPNSDFHNRREEGIQIVHGDYYNIASIKLFYCVVIGKTMVETFERVIVAKKLIDNLLVNFKKNTFLSEQKKQDVANFLRIYLKRYLFDQFDNMSNVLIGEIFKKDRNTADSEQIGLDLMKQKLLLDNFISELFLNKDKFDDEFKLSSDSVILRERNLLIDLYEKLLDSIKQKEEVLQEIKVYNSKKALLGSQKIVEIKEKSIAQVYAESGYHNFDHALMVKLSQELQRSKLEDGDNFKSKARPISSYLFDFGFDKNDIKKIKTLFLDLISRYNHDLKSLQDHLNLDNESYHDRETQLRDDILKFYNEFLLKELPQISFEYKDKENRKKIDKKDDSLIKVIIDKSLFLDVLEIILDIEDHDLKKISLETFELFLKNFIVNYEKIDSSNEGNYEFNSDLQFYENDNLEFLQSIKKIAIDQDINIRQFVNLVRPMINSFIMSMPIVNRNRIDDEISLDDSEQIKQKKPTIQLLPDSKDEVDYQDKSFLSTSELLLPDSSYEKSSEVTLMTPNYLTNDLISEFPQQSSKEIFRLSFSSSNISEDSTFKVASEVSFESSRSSSLQSSRSSSPERKSNHGLSPENSFEITGDFSRTLSPEKKSFQTLPIIMKIGDREIKYGSPSAASCISEDLTYYSPSQASSRSSSPDRKSHTSNAKVDDLAIESATPNELLNISDNHTLAESFQEMSYKELSEIPKFIDGEQDDLTQFTIDDLTKKELTTDINSDEPSNAVSQNSWSCVSSPGSSKNIC